jgi:surfeit locus 1 family protein
MPIGRRLFAPSWGFTLLTVMLCGLFITLGRWQWHRGEARQAQWNRFSLGTAQIVPLESRGLDTVPPFQRVALSGRFDPDHQFLLDNRIYQGRAGFDVLTPLRRSDGRVALVDRGWVPFSGVRSRLPDVRLPLRDPVAITGRVAELPSAGLASGRSAPAAEMAWPKITAFPSMSQLASALGSQLEPRIVLLDPQDPNGYVRDWHPTGLEPMRHWSYAVQWWCFAAVSLALWAGLSLRPVHPNA